MNNKKKERKTKGFHMRVSKEEKEELEMLSYLEDMTVSEYIRRALHCYLNMCKYAPEQLKEMERAIEENAAKTKR